MANVFDVAKSVSILKVYEKYSGNTLNKYHGGNVSCPFHGNDNKPSMHLYTTTNSYYCFSCKRHGSTIDFVKEALGLTDNLEAAKQLCQDFGLSYDVKPLDPGYKNYIDVYKFVANFYNYLLKTNVCPDHKYFSNRGLSSVIDRYLLGYCPSILIGKDNKVLSLKDILMNEFPNIPEAILDSYNIYNFAGDSIMAGRYVFTIFDSRGNPVGFSGRSLDPNEPKYLNTSETMYFKKRTLLYNYHEAKKYGSIYIVEGYCDALTLVSLGYKNVVASMGTSFTNEHFSMLKDKEIILALDNDKPGKDSMIKLIYDNKYKNVKVFNWYGSKDFNDMLLSNEVTLKHILEHPDIISAPEFVVRYCKEFLDLSLLSDRNKLWYMMSDLIGANDKRYLAKYPINTVYTPIDFDYYWTIVKRIIKGKRNN